MSEIMPTITLPNNTFSQSARTESVFNKSQIDYFREIVANRDKMNQNDLHLISISKFIYEFYGQVPTSNTSKLTKNQYWVISFGNGNYGKILNLFVDEGNNVIDEFQSLELAETFLRNGHMTESLRTTLNQINENNPFTIIVYPIWEYPDNPAPLSASDMLIIPCKKYRISSWIALEPGLYGVEMTEDSLKALEQEGCVDFVIRGRTTDNVTKASVKFTSNILSRRTKGLIEYFILTGLRFSIVESSFVIHDLSKDQIFQLNNRTDILLLDISNYPTENAFSRLISRTEGGIWEERGWKLAVDRIVDAPDITVVKYTVSHDGTVIESFPISPGEQHAIWLNSGTGNATPDFEITKVEVYPGMNGSYAATWVNWKTEKPGVPIPQLDREG